MDSHQELINFMENTLISTNNVDFGASAIGFLFALIFSFILKNMYLKYSTTLGLKAQISEILTLLALIIFILITVVKSSLALSLGLAGALSVDSQFLRSVFATSPEEKSDSWSRR